ncbi:hypothetical protein [Telluribacter sp. SYSU D00476]|uniref:hypothetical protein n=1 Tax=Telluribacter sp. SYSU D00476 TaxID=2811430 RepID=UPI001FF61577|nr:hypothetical protein [Telluribacter sp. SYSU D00476]
MSKAFTKVILGILLSTALRVQAQEVPTTPQTDTTLSRTPGRNVVTPLNTTTLPILNDTVAPQGRNVVTPILSNGLPILDPDSTRATTTQGDSIQSAARILTGDVSYLSVCAGTTIQVPFTPTGTFNADNSFLVQLIDASNNFIVISAPTKSGPISAVIPADKRGGHQYRLRVVSTSPAILGNEVSIRLLSAPTARLETGDGSASSRIMPGQEAQLRVNLTGSGPWSFRVSDGTVVRETLSNPYYYSIRPEQIQAYRLTGVANACGSGTVNGEVIVNVDPNPEPRLALKDAEKGFRVCSDTPFQVSFSATGKYKAGNNFVVQMADADGVFKNISQVDTMGPIIAQLPAGFKAGQYRLRVAASAPQLFSDTATIMVAAPTHTVLQSDSLSVKEGESADLTLRFTGGGPWFVLLSDGTYENNILTSPHTLKVNPANPTNYQITSAGGLCGVGSFSGKAHVFVKVPPSTISMGSPSQSIICSGGEVEVPFTYTGRFYAANKYIVQIADENGNWVNLPTTGKESPLKVKVTPSFMSDTISAQRLRIMATAPSVVSEPREIKVIAPDAAIGEVSGRGVIAGGGSTRIRLRFKNGLPPWSFTLSDGTTVQGTFLNPYLITVSPTATSEFTISSLKSACGSGTSMGSALITVEK